VSGQATPAWEARIRRRRCACGRPIPASSGPGAIECAEHDDPDVCTRRGCGHHLGQHDALGCAADVALLVGQHAACDCLGFQS
jgi:hypothetical protein